MAIPKGKRFNLIEIVGTMKEGSGQKSVNLTSHFVLMCKHHFLSISNKKMYKIVKRANASELKNAYNEREAIL